MVTGNEILSYRGDPNLAAGSGEGTDMPPVIDQTPINNAFTRILNDNAAWNHLQYQQKMADRDKMYRMLQQGLDLGFASLDTDKQRLVDNGTALTDYIKKNPDLHNDPNKYIDFIKKFSENNNLQKVAQMRATQAALQKQEIQNETDPDVRQKRIQFLEQQLQDPNTIPVPYQKMLDVNVDKYATAPPEIQIGTEQPYKDGNGNWRKKTRYQTPIEAIPDQTYYTPGSKTYTQAVNNYEHFRDNPAITHDDAFFEHANSEIDRKNKLMGWTPNDPQYMQPIGAKNPKTGEWELAPMQQFDKGLWFAKAFKVYDRDELYPSYQNEEDKTKRTEIAQEKEQRLADKQKYGKGQYAGENAHVNKVIDDISTLYNDATEKKANVDQPVFKTLDNEGKAIIRENLKKAGLRGGNDQVFELSPNDPRIEGMVSTSENGIKDTPDVTYMVMSKDGNPDDAKFISFSIPKDKKGRPDGAPKLFNIVDARQGAINEFNFNTPNKATNAQMIKEHENIYNAFDKRKQKSATIVPTTTPAETKEINGKTYQKINGQWFEVG